MRSSVLFVVPLVCGVLFQPEVRQPVALTGQITSSEEGPMEGVLVSIKKAGSTITTTVVTDRDGRYRFPQSRLEPGAYALRLRAVGYDAESAPTVDVVKQKTTTADLKMVKAWDLASQLSNAEWLASFPGTDAQKASVRPCTHCHTLERIVRTTYDADRMVSAIERMSTYPQLSFPMKIQKLPAPRIGGGPDSPEQRRAAWRRQAEYLATVNLSAGPQWSYALKTLPRPKGQATQVIYTEYDLPQRTRQPHDVIVDSKGLAWYASFGEQILGRLDPRTGKITEYPIPVLKPSAPTGILGVRFDKDENLWLGMQFQGGVAKFDRKTETFQTWSLPPELNGPHVQINQVSPNRSHVDGKVWLQDAGTYTVLRLDPALGKFEVFEPYKIPRPNVYDVIPDSKNNGYFLGFGREDVGRIDAKTGEIKIYKTPTVRSAPRRGMMDAQDRLWFGENSGDRIGMFDTRTERFQEWPVPTAGTWPYDVTADKNGNVWTGGEYTDRIVRLDPKTGQFIEYLLPRATNVRRVFVDNSTTPVTFWVGNNHGASIVKLEPLDTPAARETAVAASSIDGLWDAVVVANSVEIPFRFEITTTGTEAQGFFFEGDRKIGSSSGSFADGALKLEYDHLNTTLEVTLTGDALTGTYRNNRANARPQDVRMRRFTPVVLGQEDPPQLAGTWEMRRNADEATASRDTRTWTVFLRQSSAEVTGSILRVDGDTGTLVGHWKDGRLVLSHFAGERPNLFEATLNADGTLAVALNRTAHYQVMRSSIARAKGIPEPPDPSRYTSVKDPTAPFAFAFPDITGKLVSNTDAQFRGKVIVLSIGGSWCPNCHDEAPFLSELYKDYHARGLEIVGLMFENDPDPKVSRPRVQSFIKRYGVQYPMLIAGTTQPSPTSKTIAEALPQIVNFGAYPTTIYLGRDGRVRSVHAGFASPATGQEHVRLKQELRELTERLLAEPVVGSR